MLRRRRSERLDEIFVACVVSVGGDLSFAARDLEVSRAAIVRRLHRRRRFAAAVDRGRGFRLRLAEADLGSVFKPLSMAEAKALIFRLVEPQEHWELDE
jgi:hypothetical protein